jgi:hypothetical protein
VTTSVLIAGSPDTPVVAPSRTPQTAPSSEPCNGTSWDPGDGTGVSCAEYVAWSRVAYCEEGGWIGAAGSAFPDSLGISATNWWDSGGTDDTSPDVQILVAEGLITRLQAAVPDQDGCAGSW